MRTYSIPTVFLYLTPQLVLDTSPDFSQFTPEQYSREYSWTQDPLNGFWDTVRPIHELRNAKNGDCDDYAAVIGSYLLTETDESVGFTFLWTGRIPIPDHVVVHTTDTVYSSGTIHDESITEFVDRTRWTGYVTRYVA